MLGWATVRLQLQRQGALLWSAILQRVVTADHPIVIEVLLLLFGENSAHKLHYRLRLVLKKHKMTQVKVL
jgi:hypothetical protein